MKLNTVHKRNLFRRFKPLSSLDASSLASGEIGHIESVRFIDRDTLMKLKLECGDKRQRRRILRKLKLANESLEG